MMMHSRHDGDSGIWNPNRNVRLEGVDAQPDKSVYLVTIGFSQI